MHTEIEKHRKPLMALCHRYGVVRLEIFGSAARGGDFDPAKSDADFLVEFDKDSGLSALDQFSDFPKLWNSFSDGPSTSSKLRPSGTLTCALRSTGRKS